jgi:hypothetical protein
MNLMQKLLGLKPKLTARDLCIQFGCASVHVLCGGMRFPAVTQKASFAIVMYRGVLTWSWFLYAFA